MRVITCEQVSDGHPDKLCDQISDAVVTDCLQHDKRSRVAVETLVKDDYVVLAGELTSKWDPNYETLINGVFEKVGKKKLDYKNIHFVNLVKKQSKDIAMGVDKGGAGDQGMMYGYATNETPEMLPIPYVLATEFLMRLKDVGDKRLKADAKSQVSFDYDSGRITTFLCSVQHTADCEPKDFREVITRLMKEVAADRGFNTDFEKLVNPTGRFVTGGSFADCGVTGRKIACDTYGGIGRIGGGALCVDGDTEYLSPSGWKRISDYDGEKVGQWNDWKLEFVNPSAYVVNEADGLMRIRSSNVLDMVLSPMHDVVLITEKGNIIKKQARYLFDENGVKNGSHGYIPTSFEYDDDFEGLEYTDDEIRLQVAFCADGTMFENSGSGNARLGRVHVKKENKKDRMRYLLEATKTEYKETFDGEYSIFWFDPPRFSKSLYECFSGVNARQNKIIADEVQLWDGTDRVFRTTIKEDADFVQICFMKAYGTNATIHIDERIGEKYGPEGKYTRISNCYEVYSTKWKKCRIKHGRTSCHCDVEPYDDVDGKMYCFTVPSGMLVLRRNNRVFITGNCGKDPSKVDRSGAYMARKIAKDLVKLGYCDRCEVQIAYAIGVAEPVSFYVDTFGTEKVEKTVIDQAVKIYDLTPKGIIESLDLLNVDYNKVSSYGHFMNQEMPWER